MYHYRPINSLLFVNFFNWTLKWPRRLDAIALVTEIQRIPEAGRRPQRTALEQGQWHLSETSRDVLTAVVIIYEPLEAAPRTLEARLEQALPRLIPRNDKSGSREENAALRSFHHSQYTFPSTNKLNERYPLTKPSIPPKLLHNVNFNKDF